ncbi:YsnF/AvaK domain-containing protein [Paracoccus sp. T5]|uniref:YsnF/AvaK domain-containing protein n=1 Tax=Paracoccus sp. T5 TaxID=3402161 RepID=UPI003AE83EAD
MSHTVTAIFRTADVADLVRRKLAEVGVPERHIHVAGGIDRHDDVDTLHLPDEDTASYKQAVREGNYVVSAEVEDAQVDAAAEIMRHPEESVDIDAYEADYRASPDYAATTGIAAGDVRGEQSIPLAEERLNIGKRVHERGSAHVRTYVQEIPVEERVRLREERLSIERRPLDQTLTGADAEALFQERDIDVSTQSEEAVVSKEAVMTEEVVVGKEVTERDEVVRDTLRKTEVEIDRDRT